MVKIQSTSTGGDLSDPEKMRAYHRAWRKINPEKKKAIAQRYSQKHPEKVKVARQRYLLMHPWVKTLGYIRNRCVHNKNTHYFKRGIKAFITYDEVKFLWFRDKAYLMKRPSIDRIDSKGNYTLQNCRFLELSENVLISNRERLSLKRRAGAL